MYILKLRTHLLKILKFVILVILKLILTCYLFKKVYYNLNIRFISKICKKNN